MQVGNRPRQSAWARDVAKSAEQEKQGTYSDEDSCSKMK